MGGRWNYMKIIFYLLLFTFTNLSLAGDYNYIGTEHELKFKDGSYEKNKQRIVLGRNMIVGTYNVYGEFGFGEDITEGQSVGSGADYEYYKIGLRTTYFNSLDLNVQFESKLNTVGKDDNEPQINTKHKF